MPHTAHAIQPKPAQAIRRVSILGATGSIGDSTLRVIAQHPDKYSIVALTAQENAEKLIALALKFRPEMVTIGNPQHYTTVKNALASHGIEVLSGAEGLLQAAAHPCDISIAAIVGAAGLAPALQAIAQGNSVAIANKEALVCAGELVMRACAQYSTTLLPIDSEHNAIFQVLNAHIPPPFGGRLGGGLLQNTESVSAPLPTSPQKGEELGVEKITLTASGGPLLTRPLATMDAVTPAEAVNHPRWNMGAKISVDSATMMNKGLELIEAHYLFDMPESKLDVLIHPESVIHSLVHYTDGSVLAQLGMPDMAIPIAYALSWPNRLQVATPRLDLAAMGRLNFALPDMARFPALALARAALNAGPSHMIALNAANEIAVAAFLQGAILFTQIVPIVEKILEKTVSSAISDVNTVLACDQNARERALVLCNKNGTR